MEFKHHCTCPFLIRYNDMSFTRFCRFYFVFLTIFVGLSPNALSQTTHTVSGHVRDALTGETLIGASIRLKADPSVAARTNNYGFYSITLPQGNYVLIVSHVGYQAHERTVDLTDDRFIDIDLRSGE